MKLKLSMLFGNYPKTRLSASSARCIGLLVISPVGTVVRLLEPAYCQVLI